ncbi:cyclin-dependent kinases regulatory subunit [Drechmeria coniospora]|uniref:Cyclin-dependent kinases regulatory subunit n=1 Tax=Drechmeria coniospora TaxID=98403 RepID=A0A151GM38_DRECN|nr:cyclin-dependent kinases regulatory subunit [Drechmeria coniospora]KYK58166.1 cyclin-dependent kinases regulatory subunit [Drechmeria coniospora]
MTLDIDTSRRNKAPRPLSDAERARLDEYIDSIHYSSRYSDSEYEYRHVQLPKAMLKAIPKDYHDTSKGTLKLLWEDEWRAIGITQSLGWEHYEVHEPEPHILLFKYGAPPFLPPRCSLLAAPSPFLPPSSPPQTSRSTRRLMAQQAPAQLSTAAVRAALGSGGAHACEATVGQPPVVGTCLCLVAARNGRRPPVEPCRFRWRTLPARHHRARACALSVWILGGGGPRSGKTTLRGSCRPASSAAADSCRVKEEAIERVGLA